MIWGDISSITVADILYVGLVYAGFEKARQNVAISENTQRFIDFYGVPPTTAEPFFRDLRDKYPDIRYKIVLMTMNWFRLYDLERVLSGRWGYNDLQFIRNTVKNYTKKIASLKDSKLCSEILIQKTSSHLELIQSTSLRMNSDLIRQASGMTSKATAQA